MKDIENRDDIVRLVDEFYQRLIADDMIGYFFTDIARLDLEHHMPLMYDFWETTLLGQVKYKGNPMLKHIELNRKEALLPHHFDRWLSHWEVVVVEYFYGPTADKAIERARQIGMLMQHKIGSFSTLL